MSIKVNHISKWYGKQQALKDVSFEINPGELVGFLGPNGAGKSTMMKIITCFLPANKGQVEVCGYDAVNQSIPLRKKIGYLPEHNPLYQDMYVKEYLSFIGRLYKVKNLKSQLNQVISEVGLEPESHKKIGALSKGYRQRVGLAGALIHDPEVLILDEATTGLDPNQIVEIRSLIKRIAEKKTILMSTHIMQEVEAICNRVIIINNGVLVADDKVDNIKKQNKRTLLVEFDGAIATEDISAIDGVASCKQLENYCWEINIEGDKDIRKSLFDLAVKAKVGLLELKETENKLENIFKDLTGKNQ